MEYTQQQLADFGRKILEKYKGNDLQIAKMKYELALQVLPFHEGDEVYYLDTSAVPTIEKCNILQAEDYGPKGQYRLKSIAGRSINDGCLVDGRILFRTKADLVRYYDDFLERCR